MKSVVLIIEPLNYLDKIIEATVNLGHEFIFVHGNENARFRKIPLNADALNKSIENFTFDPNIKADLSKTLNKTIVKYSIKGIISICEFFIEEVSFFANTHNIPFTSFEATKISKNKFQLKEELRKLGIDNQKSFLINDSSSFQENIQKIQLPAIMKPSKGIGSINVFKIDNSNNHPNLFHEKLKGNHSTLPDFINGEIKSEYVLEEYLTGPLYSVEVLANETAIKILTVSLRFRASHDETIEIGTLTPAPLTQDILSSITQYVVSIIENLKFKRGIFHIELIYTHQGPKLVEVNPRLMGGSLPLLYINSYDHNIFETLVDCYANGDITNIPNRNDFKKYTLSCFFGAYDEGKMPTS